MKYYTTNEVADMFSVDPSTVRSWIYTGRIDCFHDKSGRCMFTDEQIYNKKHHVKTYKQSICVHYRLTQGNFDTLKLFADKKGISMNKAVNMLIEKGLVKVKKK